MLRTRVGYAGGTTASPTYRSMGDHSEAIQIDFDPKVTSYAALLDEFTSEHNPCRASFSRQYRSAVFVHDAAQRASAEQALQQFGYAANDKVNTAIEDFTQFTLAEAYHQKYRLRYSKDLMAEFDARYPTLEALLASPSATRANAYIAGCGSAEQKALDLPRMGLSKQALASFR